MRDFYNLEATKTSILDEILEHILVISKGECKITDEMILNVQNHKYQYVLSGLRMLHEDLELYKKEFKQKLEAEYKIEVLKKKNEELKQFNYVASHDLQEPLRTINSFSALLKKNHGNILDAEGQLYLQFIQDSSKRMSELIFDLLNYSKAGRTKDTQPADCKKILEQVFSDLNHIISEVKPTINVGTLPILKCCKTALHQIFQNLIGNALKFRNHNRPTKINISSISDEEMYTICISDNGIGIAPEHTNRIFGVFQRLHTKDEYEGTGIGLALCKKVIEAHQGKIWIESELGLGSKFYFSLPK